MSSSTPYRVAVDPALRDSLLKRFSGLPLKEVLIELRSRLGKEYSHGKQAPLPYAEGIRLQIFPVWAGGAPFSVSALYEVDPLDQVVTLLDIGIRPD